jgi:hypothetical protein
MSLEDTTEVTTETPAPDATAEAQSTDEAKNSAADAVGEKTTDEAQKPLDAVSNEETDAETVVEYEDFKIPEGFHADDERLGDFKDKVSKLGFSQDQAQAALDMHAEAMASITSAQDDSWKQTTDGWLTDSKADKEIGGADFDKKSGVVKTAIDKFGTPELVKLFDDYKLNNHPEIRRVFYRVGKSHSEASQLRGDPVTSQSIAERWYGGEKE